MSNIKSISSLTILVLLGLSVVSDANADSARSMRITNEHIQACVAEIGRHADYDNAARIVHQVVGLDQKNLEEMEIKVETLVFLKSEGELAREYRVSCITGATHDLVRFRIAPLANNK